MTKTDQVVGIDVGGTKILGAVVDVTTGLARNTIQVATPKAGSEELAAAISDVADALLAVESVDALGLGIPGLVDHSGVLRYGPNVAGIVDFDIVGTLQERVGLPAVAGNDAAAAAFAEHRFGAAKGARHAVIVTQGTGIGGGLIVDGRLVHGAHGFAGEPGHMLVNHGGHRCACGRAGCWESVASGTGLANLARAMVVDGRGQDLVARADGIVEHLRGEHVSAGFVDGDPDAAVLIEQFAFWVAQGLGSLVALLDPEVIVLGGGLSSISDHFIDQVRVELVDATVGGAYRPAVPVVAASLGPAAGLIGAAAIAHDRINGNGKGSAET